MFEAEWRVQLLEHYIHTFGLVLNAGSLKAPVSDRTHREIWRTEYNTVLQTMMCMPIAGQHGIDNATATETPAGYRHFARHTLPQVTRGSSAAKREKESRPSTATTTSLNTDKHKHSSYS